MSYNNFSSIKNLGINAAGWLYIKETIIIYVRNHKSHNVMVGNQHNTLPHTFFVGNYVTKSIYTNIIHKWFDSFKDIFC